MANPPTPSSPNKTIALILGIVLAAVGLLGFVPGIAQDPSPADANDANDKELLGLLGVNALHNVVHLLSGAILLAVALIDQGRNGRMANIGLGAVYALVALLGFASIDAIDQLVAADVGIRYGDAILHGLLAIMLLGVAFGAKETMPAAKPPTTGT